MTTRRRFFMTLIATIALPAAGFASDGMNHPTYQRTIKARKPGLYFRLLSHVTRGTPLKGPIPAPSNTNPRSKFYGYGVTTRSNLP